MQLKMRNEKKMEKKINNEKEPSYENEGGVEG